jgi:beta-glucanase (GH16 family)
VGSGGAAGSDGGAASSAGAGGATNAELCKAATAYAKCDFTDFSKEDVFDNPKWIISTWGNANRTHSKDNVWVDSGLLVMKVNGGTPKGQTTVGAEIATAKSYLHGSFRVIAKTATEQGTVSSPMFMYKSDQNEIDVEMLSIENAKHLVNFTVHERDGTDKTYSRYNAGFDPSAGFHEYRFDWEATGVTYYVDGKPTGVTLTGNTPDQAGKIMVNHWTLSDPGWGGGPPINDAFMYVRSLEFYYD